MKIDNTTDKITLIASEGEQLIQIENSDGSITIKSEKVTLPKTFQELLPNLKMHYYTASLYAIGSDDRKLDKFCFPIYFKIKEQAEAWIALYKLILLRDSYNEDWTPTFNGTFHYQIVFNPINNLSFVDSVQYHSSILQFKTRSLAEEFLRNFQDLILKAKMFL